MVGNDIGCGMGLWQTSQTNKVNLDILAKRLRNVESPLDESCQEYIFERKVDKQIANDAFDLSLSTIGGGNHFADFQQVVDVQNPDKLERLGMDQNRYSYWFILVPVVWGNQFWLTMYKIKITRRERQQRSTTAISCGARRRSLGRVKSRTHRQTLYGSDPFKWRMPAGCKSQPGYA